MVEYFYDACEEAGIKHVSYLNGRPPFPPSWRFIETDECYLMMRPSLCHNIEEIVSYTGAEEMFAAVNSMTYEVWTRHPTAPSFVIHKSEDMLALSPVIFVKKDELREEEKDYLSVLKHIAESDDESFVWKTEWMPWIRNGERKGYMSPSGLITNDEVEKYLFIKFNDDRDTEPSFFEERPRNERSGRFRFRSGLIPLGLYQKFAPTLTDLVKQIPSADTATDENTTMVAE